MKKNKNKKQAVADKSEAVAVATDKPEEKPRLISHDGKIWELITQPGLLSAHIMAAAVPPGNPEFNYEGPLITPEQWWEVLSFFKWANSTHHCEVQVRGYVNLEAGLWKFWAFPQEKGGMTTKELPGAEADRQRSEMIPEGYYEYISAHSHCVASAFQSSVDHNDETVRQGLHITIGHLDKLEFDIDARVSFIHKGARVHYKNASPLNWFEYPEWMRGAPVEFWKSMPLSDIDRLHKLSITSLPKDGVAFPEIWKTNLKDRPPYQSGAQPHFYSSNGSKTKDYSGPWGTGDESHFIELLAEAAGMYGLTDDEMVELFQLCLDIKDCMSEARMFSAKDAQSAVSRAVVSGRLGKAIKEAEAALTGVGLGASVTATTGAPTGQKQLGFHKPAPENMTEAAGGEEYAADGGYLGHNMD